jgi:hypothetical protein
MVHCFELWQENTKEQISMKAKSARIIHRLKNHCMVHCFELWQENTKEQISMKAKSARIIHRLKNHCMVHCFELWQMISFSELQLKMKANLVVHRIFNSALAQCFGSWADLVSDERVLNQKMVKVQIRVLHRSASVCFYSWTNLVIDKESRNVLLAKLSYKLMFRIFRRLQRSAFVQWLESIKEHKRLRRSAQRAVSRFKNKAATAAFDLWKRNVQSVKQAVRELGQNARSSYAVVKVLEGRRNTTLRWRSIRAWQQRALESKEFQVMCDKMGGVVDARMNKTLFNEWKKIARNSILCLDAIDRRSEWIQRRLIETAVVEWHSLAFLEGRRQQIVKLLRSRLYRKVISAWTHSFAWRRCVDARSGRIAHSCAAIYVRKFKLLVLSEWRFSADWHRKCKVLSKFWILKFLDRWSTYRAKYRFHRERALHAPEHETFSAQLKQPACTNEDGVARAYDLAGRLLGDTVLITQKESSNIVQAQANFSRAWLFVHRHDLHDLRPALQEIDAKVQTMSLEVQELIDVGLAIGSRLRVSWSIKVKKELSPQRVLGKNDARETWIDIWWGCTVLSRAMHKNKERDAQGNALWNVIYGEFDNTYCA